VQIWLIYKKSSRPTVEYSNSQGSAATDLRWCGQFSSSLMSSLLLNAAVNRYYRNDNFFLQKLVYVCQIYHRNKSGKLLVAGSVDRHINISSMIGSMAQFVCDSWVACCHGTQVCATIWRTRQPSARLHGRNQSVLSLRRRRLRRQIRSYRAFFVWLSPNIVLFVPVYFM